MDKEISFFLFFYFFFFRWLSKCSYRRHSTWNILSSFTAQVEVIQGKKKLKQVWVMVNRTNMNKILWCENYAQKQEAQPQIKFKHYVFLNEITVITVAAFKKRYGNNSIEVIYTFYILTCSSYLTLNVLSLTLNYANLWRKVLLIISIIFIKANTKPLCTRIFPSTLPTAGTGWIKSAEESVCGIGRHVFTFWNA